MREKALFLLLAVATSLLVVGCGSGNNAAEIAQSYGILNRCDLQPKIANLIESGQADKMIEDGQAAKRYRVQNLGDKKILVTEYLIQGEVYRVEVRKTFNPLKNVSAMRIRYGHYEQGLDSDYICWGQLNSVICSLENDSFESTVAQVATRAWRDSNGKVHPVTVEQGAAKRLAYSADGLSLTIHTDMWPMTTIWVQGIGDDQWLLLGDGMAGRNMKAPIPFVNLSLAKKF